MGYKAHDHKERRCIDCLFMKRKRKYDSKAGYSRYMFFCGHTDQEIHEIENDNCWVLSKDYPYFEEDK